VLKALIEEHRKRTESALADELLKNWDVARGHFWQICPKEMRTRLSQPLSDHETLEAAE